MSNPKPDKERAPTPQELVDIASEDSFPASDPPARTAIKSIGPPDKTLGKDTPDTDTKTK